MKANGMNQANELKQANREKGRRQASSGMPLAGKAVGSRAVGFEASLVSREVLGLPGQGLSVLY